VEFAQAPPRIGMSMWFDAAVHTVVRTPFDSGRHSVAFCGGGSSSDEHLFYSTLMHRVSR
jgi:hypothetical protein